MKMMKKRFAKIFIALIALAGAIGVGYAYVNPNMSAATTFTLDKGTKVVLGEYKGNDVVWDIGNNVNEYVLMSSVPIESKISTYDMSLPASTTILNQSNRESSCLEYVGAVSGYREISYCPVTPLRNAISAIQINNQEQSALNKNPHLPRFLDVKPGGAFGLTVNDRAYRSGIDYWLDGYVTSLSNKNYYTHYFHPIQGSLTTNVGKENINDYDSGSMVPVSEKMMYSDSRGIDVKGSQILEYALRPFATLDKSKIAFAADKTYQNGIWYNYKINSNGLNDATENNAVKLRIYDSQYSATLKGIYADGDTSKKITEVAINSKIQLDTSLTGDGIVSVLLYDKSGSTIKHFRMLGNASGQYVAVDLNGISAGEYQVAIIMEEDNGTDRPAKSSYISAQLPLEIIAPHEIQYTKTPQTGASTGIDYEYSKNVNVGDAVGKITLKPYGVRPIKYEIESNGDNSYLNFEIDGLDGDHKSRDTAFNVKIKSGVPDLDNGGLKVGTYKFCIISTDANGYPETQIDGKTKVCTSFTVNKTELTIAFDDKDDTKKTIVEAATPWNETATGDPTYGTKITYTKVGGDIGLIDIDPNTGQVTYKGNNQYGKVKIRATIDDDPSTGNDNYDPVYTEKEIIIAQEVDGVVTPDPASSDADVPTFETSDVNVKIGGKIGTIQGILGTPDVIGGSTTTYSYKIKSDPNDSGSYFLVDAKTGVITSNANLSVGSYNFMITVSDKWTSKDVSVTVNVGVAKAEELKFYEDKTSNKVIDKKEVNYTDTNVSVFATVKGSSNNNLVTYKIKDDSTNVITINANSGAVTIKGVGTVTIVATKKGASGQADATAELTFTVKAVEQEFIYTTDSTLETERPKTGERYNTLKETYEPNKTFNVYTTGNPEGSSVTYQLKAGSPTDVISVDSDGTIHILNASKNEQIGKVIVEAISHDPSGNYADKTIELPIDIEKGERKIEFKENPINVVSDPNGSVTPDILVDGVLDTSSTAVIEVDPKEDNSIAWTNDGQTIKYSWEKEQAKDIKLKVTKPADRNYKVAEAEGTLHILGADENVLTLSTPGKVTYGDHFVIRSTQDDGSSKNVKYTFETDNGVYISAPDVNGNKAEFDALAYSGSTMINITVTRTADGELPLKKTVSIKVLAKPITITIDDKEKERLEENPELTYKDFQSQLAEWNGVKDDIDTSHIKLTTTAKKTSPVGTYPITAGNAGKQLNKNYPNYTFTIKEGKLNIKDNGNKDFWDVDDDGCPDLNITITDDEGNDIVINGDQDEDGIPDYNIDINGDGKPDLNIDTDDDGKPDLNLVMLKSWKPSRCVTVNGVDYASGITAKAEINVDTDGDMIPNVNIDTDGDFKADFNIDKNNDGNADVNIGNVHTTWKPDKDYKYQNFLYDTMIQDQPLINVDTDGDGYPDVNIDLDDDGIPDINIDQDGDLIPDTDIDSTGDGKPDVNIDTDGDGEPDENIKEITEWKPEHNVKKPFGYDTMSFDDPEDDNESDDPNNPDDDKTSDKPNSEVQGSYYPGDNMGGALTGDTTNMMLYIGFGCLSLGVIFLILYKGKTKSSN